ncbi:related to DNA excision repair protein (Rad26L) [Ramularia collo-cygni]|uniref:Related to DNA excision repair protein (Rad26L) n=1 Tax=Ramularia collo-cygni TaxID=112498 RepID=A0A2D3V9I4_9PEZI|nr:related to DNA excision repair protein (Rad26L) [Ramularia collo-cygni]CZT22100.1 related to DNA excision repair protein (Rad26L) [Ramularia collo-cygni]
MADDSDDSLDIISSRVAPAAPPRPTGFAAATGNGHGERIAFSDDEDADAAYLNFKNRKKIAAKKTNDAAKKSKARMAKKGAVVGRKEPRTALPTAKRDRESDSSDDEHDLMEDTLPEYLKSRRKAWEQTRAELGNAGLLIPPHFEPDFFGYVDLEEVAERPSFPVTPPLSYFDIKLRSAGVIPAAIAQWLKPYQIDGTAWLHEMFVAQKGCLLGDDMGLGKTIQVISFLTVAFGKTGDERDAKRMRMWRRRYPDNNLNTFNPKIWYPRVLIICPGGLLANWQKELETWGWWHLYVFHGNNAAKEAALAAAENGRLEIMLTTYHTYLLNESAINNIHWDCVIADECHTIKSRKTEITQAMCKLNALCRIGLSGTMIQNNYDELWTLLNWANPGAVGAIASWKRCISIPLKIGQSHDATMSQLSKARRVATKLVNKLLPRFFKRRTKALIAHQLPKKSDLVVFCPLTETQSEAYNNFCDSELVHAIRDSALPCNCGSGKKQGSCCRAEVEGFGKWQNHVFPVLVTLQKLSNHVALLVPDGVTDPEKLEKELQRLEMAFPDSWKELYAARKSMLTHKNTKFCGKWLVLRKLLRLWYDNGDKVLVFSHSVRLLKLLQSLFNTTPFNVSYLDGSMSYADRQAAVDDFNSDPGQFVFLISTKAGGVGLNITSANKVVVVDPNWNPSYDLQAQDRAYRIGQVRDVDVFRLVSAGTVEEIVYARQIYKQQQANIGYNASVERRYFTGIQDQKDQKGEIFGLRNLFAPQQGNLVLRDIVNKTNIAETRAGVQIAGLDLEAAGEDEDGFGPLDSKEDAAINLLAAEIIDEPAQRRMLANAKAKRKDPVQAILQQAGVEYTHENAEVIGTSKIETRISSRAQKAGDDADHINELAFAGNQEDLEGLMMGGDDDNGVDCGDGLGEVRYRFRPPEDVRRRQFCAMAQFFGYGEKVTEFALVVEGWTQAERRDCLERFYLERRRELGARR